MNQIILVKDIRLMFKDLKFQIFFLILVVLFILSAISSSVSFISKQKSFQNERNRFNDLVADGQHIQLIQLLQNRMLMVASPPSPAVLFSEYDNYPDIINTGIMFYEPEFSNNNIGLRRMFRLNWLFILGMIMGLMMLIMSFEAISQEKRAGTLRLLTINGVKRQSIIWHKYISYLILYLIVIIPASMTSMILFFALTGTWSMTFMLKFLLIILISIPFASFFVWLGIFISMSKNHRNTIVMVMFIWAFFVVIVPQAAIIIAKQVSSIKTVIEYREIREQARYDEMMRQAEEENDIMSLSFEDFFALLASNINVADEKKNQALQREIEENMRQTRMIRGIAGISPFMQFVNISEIVFDKGFYLLNFQQETTKQAINQIKNLMIEQDSRDETSHNLLYSYAYVQRLVFNRRGETPFSEELFEHPHLLFVTEIETDDVPSKIMEILMKLIPILVLNLVLMVGAVGKFERLDIR